MFYFTSCSRTQVVEISQLEVVETYPKMNTWAPIKRNILTEDDNPINIPYFGDSVGLLRTHVFSV